MTKKNSNFEKEVREYFDSQPVPQLSEERMQEIRENAMKMEPKKPENRNKKIRWISLVSSCCVCLLLLVLIPVCIVLNKPTDPDTPSEIYYADDGEETTKLTLTEDFVADYINTNYSQYNFIFEDMTFNTAVGYYTPENKLLSLRIVLDEKNSPYTNLEVNLVISKQFIYSSKDSYVGNATVTNNETYTLYKRNNSAGFKTTLLGLLDYEDYDLYLLLSNNNETLFNRFLID